MDGLGRNPFSIRLQAIRRMGVCACVLFCGFSLFARDQRINSEPIIELLDTAIFGFN